ncbi:MAG: hypothetical protein JWQ90_1200 [Hydrocarboniphaga sp.]|uniref:DUF1302 domain-containing protein n=1 Tax=Hydrocarboniphaga sp. TaxID=2033016 RepID=UPI002626F22F|nr:DUF1302 family protein [Hydrocarboniphaga sp.]MDB5968750.1 hypothetical protein [Hydrocarboniphaga sp.]
MKSKSHGASGTRHVVASLMAFALAGEVGSAQAFPIDLGNPDIDMRLDNSIRYTSGVRVGSIDPKIGDNPIIDGYSDNAFGPGDLVTSRFDLVTEFDVAYRRAYGVRVSAASWYDPAYGTTVSTRSGTYESQFALGPLPAVNTSAPYSELGSYNDNRYSDYTLKYYRGPGINLLDAFAFGTFDLGDVTVSVKAGQLANYWGEGLFFPSYGIAYSQSPIDGLKGATNPGIQAKEAFLPIPQISGDVRLTDELQVGGYYALAWRHNRMPEGGTFLGPSDGGFNGPDRQFTGQVVPALLACLLSNLAVCGAQDQPLFITRVGSSKPGGQNYGVKLRYIPTWLSESASLGLYYRKFDETQAYPLPEVTLNEQGAIPGAPLFTPVPGGGLSTGTYRGVYARGTQLFGLSYTDTVGAVSVAGELSYRQHAALINHAVPQGSTAGAITGGYDANGNGPRGDLLYADLNAVYLVPDTFISPTAQLIGEMVYSRVLSVTQHPEFFSGVGYAGCPTNDKWDGCATKDFVVAQISYLPQWPNAFPSWDLSAPTSVNYGIYGNNAGVGGGNQGALTAAFGIEGLYRQRYEVTLQYNMARAHHQTGGPNDTYAPGNGQFMYSDRDWVALTFKTSF